MSENGRIRMEVGSLCPCVHDNAIHERPKQMRLNGASHSENMSSQKEIRVTWRAVALTMDTHAHAHNKQSFCSKRHMTHIAQSTQHKAL